MRLLLTSLSLLCDCHRSPAASIARSQLSLASMQRQAAGGVNAASGRRSREQKRLGHSVEHVERVRRARKRGGRLAETRDDENVGTQLDLARSHPPLLCADVRPVEPAIWAVLATGAKYTGKKGDGGERGSGGVRLPVEVTQAKTTEGNGATEYFSDLPSPDSFPPG